MQITIKKLQQKWPVKELVIFNKMIRSANQQACYLCKLVLSSLDALCLVSPKTVPWYYDCFHSCHPRSCREKEGASSKTVKSEWGIFRHYTLYPVLGSHSFISKFANESSVAGIRGHANDSCADQRCQTRSDLICPHSTSLLAWP